MVKSISKKLKGIVPPILTPLNKNETVDKAGMKRLARFMVDGGVHGIFVLGSSGEGFALLDRERIRAVEAVADEVG